MFAMPILEKHRVIMLVGILVKVATKSPESIEYLFKSQIDTWYTSLSCPEMMVTIIADIKPDFRTSKAMWNNVRSRIK
jgi:hypothetical protein